MTTAATSLWTDADTVQYISKFTALLEYDTIHVMVCEQILRGEVTAHSVLAPSLDFTSLDHTPNCRSLLQCCMLTKQPKQTVVDR